MGILLGPITGTFVSKEGQYIHSLHKNQYQSNRVDSDVDKRVSGEGRSRKTDGTVLL